jgi:hypothetical protein
MQTTINGAGYHDYEDVGLHFIDQCERVELSDCHNVKVMPISKRCPKCLEHSDTYYKIIEPSYE